MEGKNSAVIYCDVIHTVEKMKDVDAGKLFKHFLRYINDQNPEPPSSIVEIVFEPMKQQLKRDLKKWKTKSIKNAEIAKDRWDKVRKDANALNGTKKDAKSTDNVNVTVNVTDNVNEIKVYRQFAHLKISIEEFDQLHSLGYSKEDINSILDAIENYKKNSNYKSLFLTAKKWLEKEKNYAKKENEKPSKVTGYSESFNRINAERGINPNDFGQ